jgi:nigerose phosphorylase
MGNSYPVTEADQGSDMEWKIIETNLLMPLDIDRQGVKLLIGNGYIGYRGTLEEFTKEQKTATIVSGLYDKVGNQWREPVNLPNGGFVQIFYQKEPLHALSSKVISHSQWIDMFTAVHTRKTTFETADGNQITLTARRFASLAQHHLFCMEYSIHANRDCEVTIETGIDGDVWDINGPHLRTIISEVIDDILTVHAVTSGKEVPLSVSESITFSDKNTVLSENLGETVNCNSVFRRLHVSHLQNDFTFYKFISHVTGVHDTNPVETSRELSRKTASQGFSALLAEHTALWKERWDTCDIQIAGDPVAQQAIRFSIYQLLAIAPTHTEYASIPARGISGQMYKGAIFWDTEIFMLPFFTYTFPQIARNLLLYRYHTLDGARKKANEYGFRGAFYAWESQDTGEDACTDFNITDVITNRPLRTYFRDKQIHISADIPYAFWQYFTATGDASIWFDGGAEVIFECTRFFLSYIFYSPDKERYEILDVTGPDEYHERVHNNAFTNRLIAHTLDIFLLLSSYLQKISPEFYSALVSSLNFENDLTIIADIVSDLYLPDRMVNPGEIIPQFDGYLALDNVPLHSLLEKRLNPNEYLGGGNGLALMTQIIKQSDVVLMLYLFSELYPLKTKAANWEFYEPRTEHGSSLSACSYSLIAAQIGKVDYAYKYFLKTATIDMTGEGKQYVGTLYIGGTHAASNGGSWMALVSGLCGIHYANETIVIDPHLPAHWEQVTLPFMIRGQKLRITFTHTHVTVKPVIQLSESLSITVGECIYPLLATGELVIPLSRDAAE